MLLYPSYLLEQCLKWQFFFLFSNFGIFFEIYFTKWWKVDQKTVGIEWGCFFFHPIYPHGVNEWTMGIKTYINVHPVDVGDTTSIIFSSVKGGQFKKIILVSAGVSFFKTPTFVFFPMIPGGYLLGLTGFFKTKNWSRSFYLHLVKHSALGFSQFLIVWCHTFKVEIPY